MSSKPMKLAYLCDMSPLDSNLYSGGNARMYQALLDQGHEIRILSASWHGAELLRRAIQAMPEAITLRARWRVHLALAHWIARGVNRELREMPCDAVFCAYSIQSMAGLRVPRGVPLAFSSDATPMTYKASEVGQAFSSYLSLSRVLDPWITRQERLCLNKADLLLWPTEWLRDGVARLHGPLDADTHVIPWGANVPFVKAPGPGAQLARDRKLSLLFVGRDWFAKGGPLAFDTFKALTQHGISAELTVIGCTPPEMHRAPNMHIIPQLDKSVPEELARFEEAFRGAHFLVNPSFESYGFAFCEAAAYGLPALCFKAGGIPIREGINGHALAPEAGHEGIANVITGYLERPESYQALRRSARLEYETRLNWPVWAEQVSGFLKDAADRAKATVQ